MKWLVGLSVLLCVAVSVFAGPVAEKEDIELVDPQVGEPENATEKLVMTRRGAAQRGFCVNGWNYYRGSCYSMVNSATSWTSAATTCMRRQATLASVQDEWEMKYLQALAKTAGHHATWIGGYYFQGRWGWMDGIDFDYFSWFSSSTSVNKPCMWLSSYGGIGNDLCNSSKAFFCERSAYC